MTTNELSAKFQTLIDRKIIYSLTPEEQAQEVIFLTQKLADWFNSLMAILYQKEVSEKQVRHILNFKNMLEMFPTLVQELKEKPTDYFGRCHAKEFLQDKSKVLGLSESGLLILPVEGELIGLRLSDLLGANFMGIPMPYQGNNALSDVYQSLGLPQYIQKEIVDGKYLENLFSSEKIDEKTLEKFKALTQK